jgi:hypothetical protein
MMMMMMMMMMIIRCWKMTEVYFAALCTPEVILLVVEMKSLTHLIDILIQIQIFLKLMNEFLICKCPQLPQKISQNKLSSFPKT